MSKNILNIFCASNLNKHESWWLAVQNVGQQQRQSADFCCATCGEKAAVDYKTRLQKTNGFIEDRKLLRVPNASGTDCDSGPDEL
jgi:hypothetical protein